MSAQEDIETTRHDYKTPYGPKHEIPTVQKYREHKAQEQANASFYGTTGGLAVDEDNDEDENEQNGNIQDTTEHVGGHNNPKKRRKEFKAGSTEYASRKVTDPVTHLPIKIRDYTGDDLKKVDERLKREKSPRPSEDHNVKPISKSDRVDSALSELSVQQWEEHEAMEHVFPPPDYDVMRKQLTALYGRAMSVGLVAVSIICLTTLGMGVPLVGSDTVKKRTISIGRTFAVLTSLTVGTGLVFAVVYSLRTWVQKKVKSICDDSIWDSSAVHKRIAKSREPETVAWLNRLVGSIWPLINPDLFASVADTLEDVMQASLPQLVRMVSVDDLGQGSESMKILGIKWLPRGAASKTVTADGKLQSPEELKKTNSQAGEHDNGGENSNAKGGDANATDGEAKSDQKDGEGEDPNLKAGLAAEDGEFVNLEIAFAYRASEVKLFRDRAKNAHIYMSFYLPGNVKIPVWVELRGLVGCFRVRLQLTPDPPFVALCTLTLLGQPKVDLSCVPIVKHGFNILDLPLISNFVQSAIDAAMSEYVAPKSMTMDLNQMLMGDDFKKDTITRGVIVIHIKNAYGFKAGDVSIPLVRAASSDAYVSVGWAKFGKPLFTTRVILADMKPFWDEYAYLLVTPQELDAGEKIRLQLWDSDRLSADDDLGRLEVDLKELMRSEKTSGKMCDRTDPFHAMKAGESMPGKLNWSVGYFTKTRLQDRQVEMHCGENGIKTVKQLKAKSFENSKQKVREAAHDESAEIKQIKEHDFESKSTDMITNSPPLEEYPSGILSIQIHQVVGLELEQLQKERDADIANSEESEDHGSEKLPDSYCNIILNHRKIYKTRTKPKNSTPFFNAGTEKFIRDWRTTSLIISVRDARVHEDDAILGLAVIPIAQAFRSRKASRLVDFFPLSGGIGYGKVRVSLVFRSVQMEPPKPALGWEVGTLELATTISSAAGLPDDLKKDRIKLSTNLGRVRVYPSTSSANGEATWLPRKNKPIRLAVRQRYSSCLLLEFRQTVTFRKDRSPAFAVLWLKNISDEEQINLDLPVYRGDVKRAQANTLPDQEMGEKVGMIKIQVRFWRGLGKWHLPLAHKKMEVGNVMQVLECAVDNGDIDSIVGDDLWFKHRRMIDGEEEDGDDEHSDDSSDGDVEDGKHKDKENRKDSFHGKEKEKEGFTENSAQLHRKNRGIMQLKGARTLKWMKHKAERAVNEIEERFDLRDREPDIETEV